jgi:TonB-linked SusC/RagA family outer membrane protein
MFRSRCSPQRAALMFLILLLFPFFLSAQSGKIAGKVIAKDDKSPLEGVTVLVKGRPADVTVSRADGTFQIAAALGDSLLFSYTGYEPVAVLVLSLDSLPVTMSTLNGKLQDIVVIGYGTERKKDLTGAISSVSAKDLGNQPVPDVGQALEGKAAGVQVLSSGAPGANVSILIRGLGTINNSSPLVVVDGVPTPNDVNYINNINPNDIASIDILKDASASAIYGSQGANGVIIITTKKGIAGQGHLSFNMFAGTQSAPNKLEMLNASQFALLNNQEMDNANQAKNPAYSNPDSLGVGTNWQNAIFRNAPIQSYSLSYSGGSEKTDYYISGGVLDQQGIVINSKYRRYNIQFNSNQKPLSWLRTGNALTLEADQKLSGGGDIGKTLASNPVLPVYNPDGSYSGPVGQSQWYGSQQNQVGLYNLVKNSVNGYNLIGNIFLEATIIPGLTFKTMPGLTASFFDTRTWSPKNDLQPSPQTESYLGESYNKNISWNWDNFLTYDRYFGESHLTVLAGTSAQSSTFNTMNGNISGFASDVTQQLNNGTIQQNVGGTESEWSLFSLIGRINYSYKDRYLITATVRRDGSSKFGENEKYGTFPSVSAAWRVSKEPFFSGVSFFNDLKIRAGYGTNGNQNGIGPYSFASVLTSGVYVFNGNVVPTEMSQSAANPNLSWETIKSTDIGIDASFLNSRITVTVDGYLKYTTGMLVPYTLPISTGYTVSPPVNSGKVKNSGIEFSISSKNLVGEFVWNTNLNMSFNHNEIQSLDQNEQLFPQGSSIGLNGYLAINKVGYPINSFYGYTTQGLFQTSYDVIAHATQPGAAPGDIRFKNLNGDGSINDNDRSVIGNPNPKFFFGMLNTFFYKGIDFSFALQGSYGNDIYNANNVTLEAMSGANNQITAVLGRWVGPGTSNSMPRAVFGDPNGNSQNSNRYIEDGSYLRIRNVTLGYSLPKSMAARIKMSSLRIYVAAENLYTFTKYTGLDPEVGINGIDNSLYPVTRTLSVGLNLSL